MLLRRGLPGALLGALLIASSPALATLAINSQESGGSAHHSTTSPLSWSFSNTSGTLLIVEVIVTSSGGTVNTPTVTYNGVSMNAISGASGTWCSASGTLDNGVYFFALEGAATGSNTVSVTWSVNSGTNVDALGAAISFTGEKSSGPTANGNMATISPSGSCSSTGSSASVTVSGTTNGDYIVQGGGAGSSWTGPASPATQSALLNNSGNTGGDNAILSYQTTSGGSVSTGDTVSASDHWGIAAAEIIAAPATQSCAGKLLLLGAGC